MVITALYSLYILITTQRGKCTHHINNISPSFTRENALIPLHILPLLLLSLNPKVILGPLYCKYSLKNTLDCESNNRILLPSYLPKKYARTANSMPPCLTTWLFQTFKGWQLSIGLRNQKIGATPNKSNKPVLFPHTNYPNFTNRTHHNNQSQHP